MTIEDLAGHKAVNYFASRTGQFFDWDFIIDGKTVAVKMNGVVAVNDSDAYLDCGLQGFGMLQAPGFMVQKHLESGALVEVMPQWKPVPMPMSVVYLRNRHLSPKVRAFVDWVSELFSTCPLMRGSPALGSDECCFAGDKPVNSGFTVRDFVEQHNTAESLL